MTSMTSVLSVGSNPNLCFYNWKLFESKLCDLTVVTNSKSAVSSTQFQFQSSSFGNSRFSISKIYDDLQNLQNSTPGSQLRFDFIFISAVSLQDITSLCSSLSFILQSSIQNGVKPSVIVESTDYVNLELTVKKCLQVPDIEVLGIMSDFDVRSLGENCFKIIESKKESELIYIGKGSYQSLKYSNLEVSIINKLGNLLESAGFDVYKLSTPLEFLSYQWKFALPQIVLGPLSIIFEQPFPETLYDYLLAKPLISGLILEIISVIRTMNCKLFKGYDNENSLIQRCIQLNPKLANKSGNFLESPKLFYNFYNRNDLYLDLLLLQPIFLADDFQIKTPYLEFLYAVLTKITENNEKDNKSLFWIRKDDVDIEGFKLKEQEYAQLNQRLIQLQQQLQLQQQQLQQQQQQSQQQITVAKELNGHADVPEDLLAPIKTLETPQLADNLDDLTDIAVYGAQLNGESFSPVQQQQQQQQHDIPPRLIPQQQPVTANNIYAQQAYQKQMSNKQVPQQVPQQMQFQPQTQPYYNNGPGIPQLNQQSSSPTIPILHGFPLQPQQQYYQQQQPVQRRMSSMPSYQAQPQGFPVQPQYPPKPTSRKNRKSAFPGTMSAASPGMDFGGHGGMPGGNRPMIGANASNGSANRLKHQSSYNMMNGSTNNIVKPRPQHGSSTSLYGIAGNGSSYPPASQQQQAAQPGDISTSTVLQVPNQQQQQNSNSSGGSLNISSDETQRQLAPPAEIIPEQEKNNDVIIFNAPPPSDLPEPKPLGYTPGQNNGAESQTDEKKKKKKKGLFGRKKK